MFHLQVCRVTQPGSSNSAKGMCKQSCWPTSKPTAGRLRWSAQTSARWSQCKRTCAWGVQVELCCGVQTCWVWSLESAKLCWVARSCMCWEVLPLNLLGLNLDLGFTVIYDTIELREETSRVWAAAPHSLPGPGAAALSDWDYSLFYSILGGVCLILLLWPRVLLAELFPGITCSHTGSGN